MATFQIIGARYNRDLRLFRRVRAYLDDSRLNPSSSLSNDGVGLLEENIRVEYPTIATQMYIYRNYFEYNKLVLTFNYSTIPTPGVVSSRFVYPTSLAAYNNEVTSGVTSTSQGQSDIHGKLPQGADYGVISLNPVDISAFLTISAVTGFTRAIDPHGNLYDWYEGEVSQVTFSKVSE